MLFDADGHNPSARDERAGLARTPLRPPGRSETYASSTPAPQAEALQSYGGFCRRAAAYFFDLVLLAMLFAMMFSIEIHANLKLHAQAGALYGAIAAWLYFAGMESSREQATFGKMAFGLRVTDASGQRISFLRASGRHFAKILSAFIFYIGFIMVGFSARKQGLHDRLAGTLVLRGRPQLAAEKANQAPSELPQVVDLPARELPARPQWAAPAAPAVSISAFASGPELPLSEASSTSLKV